MIKPYMADISFLQPVIDAYKIGVFADKGLSTRIMNALDSLSWYGNVQIEVRLPVEPPLGKLRHREKYTKRSAYWNKFNDNSKEAIHD